LHAKLDTRDQLGVLSIDASVDPPIQISNRFHLAALVRQPIANLAEYGLGRADWQKLHEIDLVGINVERDCPKQLVIEPLTLVAFG